MNNGIILQSNIYDNRNDNVPNNNGTSDCGLDSFSKPQNSSNYFDADNKNDNEANINIYRFKFTPDFSVELYTFSKIHQFDHRKDFKEAWKNWVEDNDEIVSEEIRRLTNLGYEGDILDKMFKSARYYFRKKSTEKKAPTKRRVYQGVQKNLLEAMDSHIQEHINSEDFKPSDGFETFCQQNIEVIQEEVNLLCKNGINNPIEIKNKIKKTYKNRYYLFITK